MGCRGMWYAFIYVSIPGMNHEFCFCFALERPMLTATKTLAKQRVVSILRTKRPYNQIKSLVQKDALVL